MKKVYDKKNAKVWGTPDYMIMKYDDIESVRELPRSCKTARSARRIIDGASSKKDRLRVYKMYETTGTNAEGPFKQAVMHLSVGLNGGGSQADYLVALHKLVSCGKFRIFDCWLDVVDDLGDFLVVYDPSKGV